ncbi:MAG TPA: ScpA family protein [Methanocorpusculum sp.]|nr:ScpA family protein [Methanocorpusculum sp.]HJJ54074.1 ScpA family protein [Methanocorpusculum sp.]
MTEDLPEEKLEEPVEILYQLAKRGEIDPWNIDIVEVTERFLNELEHRRELDLRVSGRTIFYASVLLRMKSELLNGLEFEEESDEGIFDEGADPFSEGDVVLERALGPIELLEREITRRLKRKDARKRPVTLYELIKQLKLAEKAERRRQRRRRYIDSEDELFAEPDVEEIVGIAHDEDYEQMAEQIYAVVLSHPDARDPGVSLYELSATLHWPLYFVYLPCLFLVQSGWVDLEQDEFFSDLWVVISNGYTEKGEKTA